MELKEGDAVRIKGSTVTGTVLDVEGNTVIIEQDDAIWPVGHYDLDEVEKL